MLIVARPGATQASGSVPSISASYITISTEAGLTNERVLTAGSGITVTDNGANSSVIVALDILPSSSNVPVCSEVPSGAIDGANRDFVLSQTPGDSKCVSVYVDGTRQRSGSAYDYVFTGSNTVHMQYSLTGSQDIFVDYFVFGPAVVIQGESTKTVYQEVPSGNIDGVNSSFTLEYVPTPTDSVLLFKSGLAMMSGSGNDYIIAGSAITFANAPVSGSNIFARYDRVC